ncbi:ABC transporter permease [Isobaculum melis]|uniref:ABC-2 type transport system permease protein n=1 Tax=Isobaculum melis TaxID=142588 RepID=A0A1H9UEG1_9LACT|nr:ABC transporter permease [Isobaculum melis]SES07648.1 ABC-2 type transport system permease protein [Isobaculum melis]
MLMTQLKMDLKMFFRETFYIISIIIPPVSYLLMGQMYGDLTYAGGLSYAQLYTPTFIILISFVTILFSFGFDQVSNRSNGTEKRIQLSPVSSSLLLVSGILKATIITGLGFVFITTLGVFVYDLQVTPVQMFLSFLGLILLDAVMLLLSSAIYSIFKSEKSALGMSIVLFQVVLLTGGFTIPLAVAPKVLQVIGHVNPMNYVNQFYTHIWNGTLAFSGEQLNGWIYLAVLSVLAYAFIIFQGKRKK